MSPDPEAAADASHPRYDLRYFFFRHRDHAPIAVGIISLIALWFVHPDFGLLHPALGPLAAVATVTFIILGELLRIWSVGYSGKTTRAKSLKAPALATGGPYKIVRNPIYVGNFLLGLGFALIPRVAWLVVVYVVYFAIQYRLIVSIEEEFLEGRFGDDYRAFKARVPRFLPHFGGLLDALFTNDEASFQWRDLRGERWTLLNMLVIGALLFGLNVWLRAS